MCSQLIRLSILPDQFDNDSQDLHRTQTLRFDLFNPIFYANKGIQKIYLSKQIISQIILSSDLI